MGKINVRYSDVTPDKLDMYYVRYFYQHDDYEMKKEKRNYSIMNFLVWIVRLLVILFCHNALQQYLLRVVHINGLNGTQNAAVAFCIEVLIIMAWWMISGYCFRQVAKINYTRYVVYLSENRMRYHLEHKYKVYFKLQEVLKREDVYEIENDINTLVVKYVARNGLIEKEYFPIGEYKNQIIQKDALDFTWMDRAIDEDLAGAGFLTLDGRRLIPWDIK